MADTWILGATGRAGRSIARELAKDGVGITLVGRNGASLAELAATLPGECAVVRAAGLPEALARWEERPGRLLVNTIGPFAKTGPAAASAALRCAANYVDLANELTAVAALLDRDAEARSAGSTLVTGAGFGVAATEGLVAHLRGDRPPAASVRVTAIPVVDALGPAVLASVVESLGGGGAQIVDGQVRDMRLGAGYERINLPDGTAVRTVAVPTGELLAAQRAADASNVVAASSEVPAVAPVRAALPLVALPLRSESLRRALLRLIDRFSLAPPARSGTVSYAHARLTWPDGTRRSGWLSAGEGYEFTANVASAVSRRIALGGGTPGAFTPVDLFGPDIVRESGGRFGDESAITEQRQ